MKTISFLTWACRFLSLWMVEYLSFINCLYLSVDEFMLFLDISLYISIIDDGILYLTLVDALCLQSSAGLG